MKQEERRLFEQTAPTIPANTFLADRVLASIVRRRCASYSDLASSDLTRFAYVLNSPEALQNERDANQHLPILHTHNEWGARVNRIDTAHGWKAMKDLAAREGLIALGYTSSDPSSASNSNRRIHQFAKLFLFSPRSAMFICPLAMTDGAARVLLSLAPQNSRARTEFLPRLLSRDPARFATSGQWMTEKPGGSDVANSETVALPVPFLQTSDIADHPSFLVHGRKWFSSATDADITLLLAREGVPLHNNADPNNLNDFTFRETSRGLSLFFGEVWVDNGSKQAAEIHHHAIRSVQTLNGISIVTLKNKHGTKQLPTAELEINGMRATRIGDPFKGVKAVAIMLNITRLYAAIGSVAGLRYCLFVAKDFAAKRIVFGKLLVNQPLQACVLADLEILTAALTHSVFYVVELLGITESDETASHDDAVLLRFLTPVMKAWCSKLSIAGTSECMEALGGVGYIEETGISTVLKDISVNAIWEGATNVMSLDLVRVLVETKGAAANIFVQKMKNILDSCTILGQEHPKHPLSRSKAIIESLLVNFPAHCESVLEHHQQSRSLLFLVGYIVASVLLIEQAVFSGEDVDVIAAKRWTSNKALNGGQFGVSEYEDNIIEAGQAKL
ncbi:hypothetical protein HK100_002131 [Physocladia obscura]|uniref:Acyl-CoA dehydrogenase n=1 Tax=Physocladia obscura TaxID=109957 RepID=A0AAD5SVQ0_9FUNG|nr:hypothetical protein HK100_002131 [Physocladia obscura]